MDRSLGRAGALQARCPVPGPEHPPEPWRCAGWRTTSTPAMCPCCCGRTGCGRSCRRSVARSALPSQFASPHGVSAFYGPHARQVYLRAPQSRIKCLSAAGHQGCRACAAVLCSLQPAACSLRRQPRDSRPVSLHLAGQLSPGAFWYSEQQGTQMFFEGLGSTAGGT